MQVCIAYWKVFARPESFCAYRKIAYKMKPELLSALKFSRLSGNLSDYLETFRTVRKLSRLSGNLPDYLETFRTVRKFSRLSGNFPDCPETFQTVWKLSRQSGIFPDIPHICHFFYISRIFENQILHPEKTTKHTKNTKMSLKKSNVCSFFLTNSGKIYT